MEKGSRYIKFATIAIILANLGLPIVDLFFILEEQGVLEIDYASMYNTDHCAGSDHDLCKLGFGFHNNQTWYLRKGEEWLNTSPPIETIDMYVKWGPGWRRIPLDTGCTGAWCGCGWCKYGITATYAFKWKADRDYEVEYRARKDHPRDVIDWSFNPKGAWGAAAPKLKCKTEKIDEIEYVQHYKNVSTYHAGNDSISVFLVTDYVEEIKQKKDKCIKGTEYIQYAEEIFEYKKENKGCGFNTTHIWCDSSKVDGNGDGVYQSGETLFTYVLTDKIELESIMNGKVKIK